jgi:hypothetical protein
LVVELALVKIEPILIESSSSHKNGRTRFGKQRKIKLKIDETPLKQ